MDPPGVHGAMLAWADDAIERGHFREGAFRFAPAPVSEAGSGSAAPLKKRWCWLKSH